MADDFLFEEGEQILLGAPDQNDFVYADGELVSDRGQSSLAYIEGIGLGGLAAQVTIRDSQGETSGDIVLISRDMSVVDYVEFDSGPTDAAATGPISDEMLDLDYTSFLLYEDGDGELFFGLFHDEYNTETEDFGMGDVQWDLTGLPDPIDTVIEDDEAAGHSDEYPLSPPTGAIKHGWGPPNTDGVIYGVSDEGGLAQEPVTGFSREDLTNVTITFSCTSFVPGDGELEYVRFIGDGGTSVVREWDGTNTEVEIQFGQFSDVE